MRVIGLVLGVDEEMSDTFTGWVRDVSFPAANRDPKAFPDADKVIIDRQINRHVAFGAGIHRCAGSNLARMELRVALEEWLARIPEFELEAGREVAWAGGQVRGPRALPVVFLRQLPQGRHRDHRRPRSSTTELRRCRRPRTL